MSLALLRFAPTLRRETVVAKTQSFVPLGRLYEGYLDDNFGKCFRSLLIDRIAFGSQHSGLHEFDVGQRPTESLGSWTPFRLQKISYTEIPHTSKALVVTGLSSLRDELPKFRRAVRMIGRVLSRGALSIGLMDATVASCGFRSLEKSVQSQG
jgi:hypothetical protein